MTLTSMARKAWLAAIVATFATSCTSASRMGSTVEGNPPVGSSSDVITTSELKRLDPGLSVMDAVEHARPWFLHPRGSVSMVSIDGSPATDASVLQMILAGDVKEVRLLRGGGSGPAAIRRDGSVVVGDVILVVTRKGRE
jgi:hypothetical protein